MVARYDIDGGYVQAVEGGSWVDFEEHQREAAQLQSRVAELEGALRSMYENFQPHAWGSPDNKRDALAEAREVLGDA